MGRNLGEIARIGSTLAPVHPQLDKPSEAEHALADQAAAALAELCTAAPGAQRPQLTALLIALVVATPLDRSAYLKLGASLGCGSGAAKRWLTRTTREAAAYLIAGGDIDPLAGRLAFIIDAFGRPAESRTGG